MRIDRIVVDIGRLLFMLPGGTIGWLKDRVMSGIFPIFFFVAAAVCGLLFPLVRPMGGAFATGYFWTIMFSTSMTTISTIIWYHGNKEKVEWLAQLRVRYILPLRDIPKYINDPREDVMKEAKLRLKENK